MSMPLSLLLSLALDMSMATSFTDDSGGGSVVWVLVEASSSWTGGLVFFSIRHCLGGMLMVSITARN